MWFAARDLERMVYITFACNESAAQTVAVLTVVPRSGRGPGAADCEIAVKPALEFAHRSGWGVCFFEAENITLGRIWRPVGKIHGKLFTEESKMGNVLDENVEMLDSFGRASRPVECSALGAKHAALVRAGACGLSRIGSFANPLNFVPRRIVLGRDWR